MNNKIVLDRDTSVNNTFNRLKSHITATGAYKLELSDDLTIEPSILFRATAKAPFQTEITCRGIFRDMIWAGASFRTQDAIVIMAGYDFREQLFIGYSFDITVSSLNKAGNGTHEIVMGARFNKIRSQSQPEL
mgnify:CR=1 FL=1